MHDTRKRPARKAATTRVGAAGERADAGHVNGGSKGRRVGGMGPAARLGPVQTKVAVGTPGDRYEKEADQVADQVVGGREAGQISRIPAGGLSAQRMADEGANAAEGPGGTEAQAPAVQPKCATCEAEERGETARTQDEGRAAGPASEAAPETVQTKCARCEAREAARRKADQSGVAKAQTKAEDASEPAQSKGDGEEGTAQAKGEQDDAQPEDDPEQAQAKNDDGQGTAQMADDDGAAPQRSGGFGECLPSGGTEAETDEAEPDAGPTEDELACGGGAGGGEGAEGADAAAAEGSADCGAATAVGEGDAAEGSAAGGGEAEQQQAPEEPTPAGAPGCAEDVLEDSGEPDSAADQNQGGGQGPGQGQDGEDACSEAQTATEETIPKAAGGETSEGSAAQAQDEEQGAAQSRSDEDAAPDDRAAQTMVDAGAAQTAKEEEPAQTGEDEGAAESAAQTGEDEGAAQSAEQEEARAEEDEGAAQSAEEEEAQTKAGGGGAARRDKGTVAAEAIRSRGTGTPLGEETRGKLEQGFGADLSGIRVHQGAGAAQANREMRSKAFAHRNHIWLGAGQSPDNLSLMAHEVTHAFQQGAMAGAGPAPKLAAKPGRAADGTAAAAPDRGGQPGLNPTEDAAPAARTAPAPGGGPAPDAGAGGGLALPKPGGAAPRSATTEAAGAAGTPAAPGVAARPAAALGGGGAGVSADAGGQSAGPAPAPEIAGFRPGGDSAAAMASAFTALPALSLPAAYAGFETAVRDVTGKRRANEAATPPEATADPGRPRTAAPRPAPPPDPRASAEDTAPAPTRGGSDQPAPKPTEHLTPAPTVDTGDDAIRAVEAADEGSDPEAALARWNAAYINRLPDRDAGANTDPGPVPTVNLTQDADPSQIDEATARGSRRMTQAATEMAGDRAQGFGEDQISAEMAPETHRSPLAERPPLDRTVCPGEDEAKRYTFDPADEADLSARAAETLRPKAEAETARIAAAEDERDRTIDARRRSGADEVAMRHRTAAAEQDATVARTRAEVDAARADWAADDADLIDAYEKGADREADEARRDIRTRVDRDEGEVAREHERTKNEAEGYQRQADADIAKAKEEARAKPRGLFSRIGRAFKDAVASATRWLSDKISQAVDWLRSKVSAALNRFKQWALDKIEKLRAWAVQRLEAFRTRALQFVDDHLGRFPGIARRARAAINGLVDGAQAAVNTTAKLLGTAVAAAIDMLAFAIDTALALAEGVIQLGLSVFCNLTVLAVNTAVLLVDRDIDALIELINDLPEPAILGPLWAVVKYAFLGFLERIRDKPADEKKRYVTKVRWLAFNPKFMAGALVGTIEGFVVDGIVGLVRLVWDLVTGIPKLLYQVWEFFKARIDDIERIDDMVDEAKGVYRSIRAFLARPDAAAEFVAYLKRTPTIFFEMLKTMNAEARGWAYKAGQEGADKLFSFVLGTDAFDIGRLSGRVLGMILFEIALFYFTAGAGTLAKWGAKAIQILLKAGRFVARSSKLLARAFASVQRVVKKGLELAQQAGGKLRGIFARVERLFDSVVRWFNGGMKRMRRRKTPRDGPDGGKPRPRPGRPRTPGWLAFVAAVKSMTARYAKKGVARATIKGAFLKLMPRHKKAVVPTSGRVREGEGHWELTARPVKAPLAIKAGEALMDRGTRWRLGVKDVRARMRRVTDAERSEGALDRILAGYKRRWKFSRLDAVTDRQEHDFNIMAGMSPDKEIAEVPSTKVHAGTSADPIPLTWYKAPGDFQTVDLTVNGQRRSYTTRATRRLNWHDDWQNPTKTVPVRIGIESQYEVPMKAKLQRTLSRRIGIPQKRYREVLAHYGFDWSNKDADHVTDLGMGGVDRYRNIYPLDKTINRLGFTGFYNKRIVWKDSKTSTKISRLSRLTGKWFRIRGFSHDVSKPDPDGAG